MYTFIDKPMPHPVYCSKLRDLNACYKDRTLLAGLDLKKVEVTHPPSLCGTFINTVLIDY